MEKRYGLLKRNAGSQEMDSCDMEVQRMERQDIYYELTPIGIVLCAAAGIAAELLVLAVFGIQPEIIPVPVFGFLWLLFGILVSGVMIGLEMLMGLAYGREYRPVEEGAGEALEYSDFRKAS